MRVKGKPGERPPIEKAGKETDTCQKVREENYRLQK